VQPLHVTKPILDVVSKAETALTEIGDEAARAAESVFWDIVKKLENFSGGDAVDSFWPPLESDASAEEEEW
jgi:hypothetical protein